LVVADHRDSLAQIWGVGSLWSVNRRLLPYFVLVGLSTMTLGGIFALLGEIRDELGFSETSLGIMVALGFFSAFGAQVGLSRFADNGHARFMIRAGLLTVVAGLVIVATASSLTAYMLARVLLGVGVGTVLPAVRRLVIVADPQRVGKNMGILGAFDIGGFLVGPLISGLSAEFWGFRSAFWVLIGLLVASSPVLAALPRDPGGGSTERHVVRVLLKNRAVVAILVSSVGWYAMLGSFEAIWALVLTDLGASPSTIGFTLSLVVLPMLLLAPFAGPMVQSFGPLRAILIGVVLIIPMVVAYGYVNSIALFIGIAALQGLADSFIFPGGSVGVALAVDDDVAAAAQGLQGGALALTAGTVSLFAGATYEAFGRGVVFSAVAILLGLGAAAGFVLAAPLRAEGHEVVTGRPISPT